MNTHPAPVSMRYTVDGHRIVVTVAGELDLSTAADLRDGLADALDARTHRGTEFVVDLRAVGFLASSGISALLLAYQHCQEHRLAMQIVADDTAVTRPLRLLSLDATLGLRCSG